MEIHNMAKKPKFTNGDDKWKGTNGVDDVNAKGGDDTLNGRGGNDILLGGGGNDTIKGGAGDDRMVGGSGDDKIDATVGNDTVDGGTGDDRVTIAGNLADATIEMDGDYYSITIGTQTTRVKNVELFTFDDGTFDTADLDQVIEDNTPKTFTLTAGVDDGAEFTGGSKDDIFEATNTTFTALDSLDGGDGSDTITITNASGTVPNGNIATVKNIENLAISSAAGAITTNVSAWTGLESIVINNAAATLTTLTTGGNATSVTVAGGAGAAITDSATTDKLASVTLSGQTAASTITSDVLTSLSLSNQAFGATVTAAAGTRALAVSLNNVTGGTITDATATTVNVTATGAASSGVTLAAAAATAVTLDAAVNLTAAAITTDATAATLTVTGAGTVNVGTLDDGFTTVNASAATGGLTATLSASTTATVTGSKGNDAITTGAVLTTGSVAAGDGTDTLVVTDSTHLATAALGAKYTGFETLQVNNGVAVDLDNITGITSIVLNDGAGATAVTDLTAAQAAAITVKAIDGAATIGVAGATAIGQIDTVGLTFSDGDATGSENITGATANLTLAGVETLNITATDDVDITQSAAWSANLTTVTLSGAGDISFVTGDIATTNFSLNASASTGTNVLNASGFLTNGVSISGGSGVDTITGSAQADLLTGNAGADIISAGAGADTVTGGAGADTITLAAGADTLVFNSLVGADTIADYVVADDSIQLSRATFTGLGAVGALTAAEFASGAGFTAGQDASDRIVYDTTSGNLYYDADGNGSGAAVLIGTFTGAPALVVGEFSIVA